MSNLLQKSYFIPFSKKKNATGSTTGVDLFANTFNGFQKKGK